MSKLLMHYSTLLHEFAIKHPRLVVSSQHSGTAVAALLKVHPAADTADPQMIQRSAVCSTPLSQECDNYFICSRLGATAAFCPDLVLRAREVNDSAEPSSSQSHLIDTSA